MSFDPGQMSGSEKTAWGLGIVGYAVAAMRYIFGAGSLKQRLETLEVKVGEQGKTLDTVSGHVQYIRGQLDKMNGKGH